MWSEFTTERTIETRVATADFTTIAVWIWIAKPCKCWTKTVREVFARVNQLVCLCDFNRLPEAETTGIHGQISRRCSWTRKGCVSNYNSNWKDLSPLAAVQICKHSQISRFEYIRSSQFVFWDLNYTRKILSRARRSGNYFKAVKFN